MAHRDPNRVRLAARQAIDSTAEVTAEQLPPDGQSWLLRTELTHLAFTLPMASLGACSAHGQELLFEGRDDGLWVSCGASPPCEWKLA